MPDASHDALTSWARLAAWWRRGWDAELLACAPAKDERGLPLRWDFAHPVNRSPLWRLLRPWYLFPTVFVVGSLVLPLIVRGGLPTLEMLGARLALLGVIGAVIATSIRRRQQPRIERLALKAYRQWRWRGTTARDAAVAAALERERTPKRLLSAPGATSSAGAQGVSAAPDAARR